MRLFSAHSRCLFYFSTLFVCCYTLSARFDIFCALHMYFEKSKWVLVVFYKYYGCIFPK